MVLVMVCRSWRNCAACPPPRPSTRHRRSPCHHPTVPWWGLALLFSPLLIIWNKIHDSQSLCLGVQYLILWLPHLLLSAVLMVSVSEILGEGPDEAVQVQRVHLLACPLDVTPAQPLPSAQPPPWSWIIWNKFTITAWHPATMLHTMGNGNGTSYKNNMLAIHVISFRSISPTSHIHTGTCTNSILELLVPRHFVGVGVFILFWCFNMHKYIAYVYVCWYLVLWLLLCLYWI